MYNDMSQNWGKYISVLIAGTILTTVLFVSVSADIPSYAYEEQVKSLSEGPWPSFGRDMSNTRLSPYNSSNVDGTIEWIYEADDWLWSSPAIGSEGLMYFGSAEKNNLYAVDIDDGTLEWVYSAGGDILSSPAVSEDETIYFGSGDHNIYALNSDGSLKWTYQTQGEIYSSPTVDDHGNVYIGSYDQNLYSIDEEGDLNWKFSSDSWIWSSPSIGEEGVVYVGSGDGNLYAIDQEDGTEIWNHSTGETIFSSPAIDEDGNIYFGSNDGYLYSLDSDGDLRWKFDIGDDVRSSPAIGVDGTIYVGSCDGNLYAVDEGTLQWYFETVDMVRSSPALSADGQIYFGSFDGTFYALDADGELEWSHDLGRSIYSSPAICEDGMVYVNSWDDTYAFTGSEDLPEIGIDIWREVEMTVRIAGRIHNSITAVVEEDGEYVDSVELTRKPGRPQEESMSIEYREGSYHNLTLVYEADHRGANPVWVTFTSGEMETKLFENFNYNDGSHQEVIYDLSDEIGEMMLGVRKVHFSAVGDHDENMVDSYEWDFGDGNSSSGRNVTHEYCSPGEYEVTLTVSFSTGETIIIERTLTIDSYTSGFDRPVGLPAKPCRYHLIDTYQGHHRILTVRPI